MTKEEPITKEFAPHEYTSPDFKSPSKFFILNALNYRVYFITRSREKASKWNDEIYGKGFYNLRVEGLEKSTKTPNVKCTVSNLSRKGLHSYSTKNKQGFGL